MNLHDLVAHLRRGGAATLNHPATYAVADGAVIAPARYASARGSGAEFVFETRFLSDIGSFARTVLIDSKGSQSNRSEDGLIAARREGGPAELIPALAVVYPGRTLLDWELPHRAFDAHIRAGTQEGVAVVQRPWYRSLRDATAVDLSPVFITSPVTLALGGWDSSRNRGQLRLRSLYVSELFALVSEDERTRLSRRSGARLDPLGQDFHVSPADFEELLGRQRDHMSQKTVAGLDKKVANARKDKGEPTLSASSLGLGGVRPGLEVAYGVSVPEVRRARTYSLAGLRRLRFGGSAEDDVAARTALLGLLLVGTAYADADPEIRAYCDVAAPRDSAFLDGERVELDLTIESTVTFLTEAIDALPERLAWTGQTQTIDGDPSLDRGARAMADEES